MKKILLGLLFYTVHICFGQLVPTAMPSLNLPNDVRGAGMGGVGSSLDADANAMNTNPARLALLNKQHNISADIFPFSSIASDAKKFSLKYTFSNQATNAMGLSVNYYTGGYINLRDQTGVNLTSIKYSEFSVGFSYGLQVSSNASVGVTLRYLHQSGLLNTNGYLSNAAGGVGADVGFLQNIAIDYYHSVKIGTAIQNIGSKINGNYQPMNFSLSATYFSGIFDNDDHYNDDFAWLAGIEFNKPLVPSTPVYDTSGNIISGKNPNRSVINLFTSTWADAPGGFKNNLRAINTSIYGETIFDKVYFIRAGFTYEDPGYGNRTYLALGTGINWYYDEAAYKVNIAYLLPIGNMSNISPLKNTYALQFTIQFGKN